MLTRYFPNIFKFIKKKSKKYTIIIMQNFFKYFKIFTKSYFYSKNCKKVIYILQIRIYPQKKFKKNLKEIYFQRNVCINKIFKLFIFKKTFNEKEK